MNGIFWGSWAVYMVTLAINSHYQRRTPVWVLWAGWVSAMALAVSAAWALWSTR